MANPIPVHTMQQPLNAFGSYQQGYQFGAQSRARKQAEEERNMLRTLGADIIGGDPAAFDQAAAINPEAATQYQNAGDSQLRRMKGAIDFIEQAKQSGNPQAVEAAYQQVRPYLNRMSPDGVEPPMTFAEAEPKFLEAKARIAMAMQGGAVGRVQSTYVDGEGNRVAIMADGTQKVLGANDAGMSQQSIEITGADGRTRRFTFDKRTGNYVPAGTGGYSSALGSPMQQAAPAGTQANPLPPGGTPAVVDAITENANRMIQSGVPEQQVDAWVQSQLQPQGNPLQATQAVTGSPFVGRSPEEQAALTEQAKADVELRNLPERQRLETEGALTRAQGQADIERSQKKMEGEAKARLSLDQAAARIQRVDSLVNSIMPRINSATAGWLGGKLSAIDGTPAADLRRDIGTLQAIAGFDELNAMRAASPTGGALGNVTERELAFLQSVVRNIENSQSPEQLRRNLAAFQEELRGSWKRVNDAYQQDYGQARTQQSAAPSASGWSIQKVN